MSLSYLSTIECIECLLIKESTRESVQTSESFKNPPPTSYSKLRQNSFVNSLIHSILVEVQYFGQSDGNSEGGTVLSDKNLS